MLDSAAVASNPASTFSETASTLANPAASLVNLDDSLVPVSKVKSATRLALADWPFEVGKELKPTAR